MRADVMHEDGIDAGPIPPLAGAEEWRMAGSLDYRLYLLDREGRIVRAEIIQCPGDPEAITAARVRAAEGPYSTEVWFRSRRVGYFPHDARPPRRVPDARET